MKMKRLIPSVLAAVLLLSSCFTVQAEPTSVLKLGCKGPEVRELQQKLAEQGFLEEKYVTGFFGLNTEDAVKSFQKENSIKRTGMVAEQTVEALYSDGTLNTRVSLSKNDKSHNVKKLQQALFELGYLDEESVTGFFGDKTEAAVKQFQKDNGISETGTAGQQTLEQINTLRDVTMLNENRTYTLGDKDDEVKLMQTRLYELGYLEQKYVTGYYGAITEAAVKKFQKNNQINQTGTVAELTLKVLNSLAAKTKASIVSEPDEDLIAKPGTLRLGDSGHSVRDLQKNLKTLGYYSGTPDGKFDEKTRDAVTKFQKVNSLTADGVVNNKTQSKIAACLVIALATPTPKPKPTATPKPKATATPKTTAKATAKATATPKNSKPEVTQGTNSTTVVIGDLVTVSDYNSANMELINAALKILTKEELDDIKLMAKVIRREVGNCNYKTQLAVGNVIMNRVRTHLTGDTIPEIIYAKNQFSTATATLKDDVYTTSTYYAAIEAYMGVKPVGECLFFCGQSIRYTCWAGRNRTFYCNLGTESFFL